ncbi:MAG: 30S ribosomal protein S5 [Pseudomonadota bacterium]|uniref:30S ribosomal subunit protein S5 n=1 Tax=anaerobic digester metagenome TaxID=1263854 RepID=A0A485LXD9_9ZZZZ|nr:30S ribosomal protein S5 [Pseudomonadota bacterium]HON39590.1 30S ribosomal protein S5 [Deltaproteobacteria bacterium]HPD22303.1 30S ribosomal protein S5 [Deltaproteobacteria bacterium]HRS57256.1 30S ribosomal protein S5 [Desulfomonilia bacterium]HRV36687.1 30S ribosomal protein S5 [Desulfomonilia bacterium]
MARIDRESFVEESEQLIDKVVYINRVAKVVKGGKRFRFSALVVVGDGNGRVGHGIGKAKEVATSIRKGFEVAKKTMVPVSIIEGTVPHPIVGEFGSSKVVLKPAPPGTGVIAGNAVRAVLEAAGLKNVVAKTLGSRNHNNVIRATFEALRGMETRESVEAKRGISLRPAK